MERFFAHGAFDWEIACEALPGAAPGPLAASVRVEVAGRAELTATQAAFLFAGEGDAMPRCVRERLAEEARRRREARTRRRLAEVREYRRRDGTRVGAHARALPSRRQARRERPRLEFVALVAAAAAAPGPGDT